MNTHSSKKPALTREQIQEVLRAYEATNYPTIIRKQTRTIFKLHRHIACLEKNFTHDGRREDYLSALYCNE